MAEIQLVYRKYCCRYQGFSCDYSMQCHTAAASDVGCELFKKDVITDACKFADIKHKYKGLSAKAYDIEPSEHDPYNPHLDCMIVKIGKNEYECDKVILNGECIYNNLIDNEGESSP